MPKLPTYENLGERPTPRSESNVVSFRPQPDGAAGRSLVAVGKELSSFGDEFYRKAKIEEKRINTLRAEEAWNKLRDFQLDQTTGEQNGFLRHKGADAVNAKFQKDYTARFDDQIKRIADSLENDDQREMFSRRAQVTSRDFREKLLLHIGHESDTYAKQVFASTVDTELRGAVANWNSPNDIALSIERVNAAVNAEAERSGWSPEMKAAAKLKAESQIHSSVIGQALATGNTAYAQKYYEANKGAIDTTTAKALQKSVEDGEQKQLSNNYRSRYISGRNDINALSALEAEISSDKTLDDGRKNALLGPIASRRDVLAKRMDMERDRAVRNVQRQLDKLETMTLSGYEITPEQGLAVINATKGTELEANARNLVATAQATREFRLSPPPRQESMLNDLEGKVRKNPTPDLVNLLGKYKTIADRQRQEIQNEPVTFAYRQGLAQPQTVDMSNPEASPGLLDQVGVARYMSRNYGAPFKPLMPDQVADVRSRLDNASPEQKMEWFGNLRRALFVDTQGYSAIMAQLAPDSPVTAIAGEFAGKGRNDAAALMLRGEQILRPRQKEDGKPDTGKLLPMPKEQDMRMEFDRTVRDAYAGNATARNGTYQAARAVYAALSSDAGDKDTQILDRDRWKQSIEAVTGGIERYNGQSVPLPHGMSRSDFTEGVAKRADDFERLGLLPSGVTASTLKSRPLIAIGDGRYAVSYGPNARAVDKNGRMIVINFNVEPADAPIEEPTEAEIAGAQRAYFGRGR